VRACLSRKRRDYIHLAVYNRCVPGIRIPPGQFSGRIPGPSGERSTLVYEHGTLLYAPRGKDPQQPHTRDEIYVVISGRGTFVHGDRRDPFEPNDFLFAAAGLTHRFEDFTDDLLVWVMYYGPEGGEKS